MNPGGQWKLNLHCRLQHRLYSSVTSRSNICSCVTSIHLNHLR